MLEVNAVFQRKEAQSTYFENFLVANNRDDDIETLFTPCFRIDLMLSFPYQNQKYRTFGLAMSNG
jgi:hypothetical protein